MSTTTLQLRSLPDAEGGSQAVASATAWAFGAWKQLGQFTLEDIYVYGLQFQETRATTADTTYEALFEIGIGMVGREVTKIQIPYSYRSDTAVAYYLKSQYISLAEPVFIPCCSTISVRVANSVAAEDTYASIKLRYMGTKALVPPSVSNDNVENFKSVSAGSGISVAERAW